MININGFELTLVTVYPELAEYQVYTFKKADLAVQFLEKLDEQGIKAKLDLEFEQVRTAEPDYIYLELNTEAFLQIYQQ